MKTAVIDCHNRDPEPGSIYAKIEIKMHLPGKVLVDGYN
jgi:hypothetical protein